MKLQNVILSTSASLGVNSAKNLLRMQDISDKQRDPSSKTPQDDKGIFWRSQLGLTLIEVLVAMGIATVAGVLLLVIIVNSAGLFTQQSSKVQEGLNINDALALIRSNIKQSNAVAASYTAGSTTYTSSASQLVLKVSSIDSAGNMISDAFDYFIFYSDQGVAHFRIFPDALSSRKTTDRVLATNADSLTFQYFNAANPPVEVSPADSVKVRVILILKQSIGMQFETNTATTEANLRND